MASINMHYCTYPGCGYATADKKTFQRHLNVTNHRNTKGGWVDHAATSSVVTASPSPAQYSSTGSPAQYSSTGGYQTTESSMTAHSVQAQVAAPQVYPSSSLSSGHGVPLAGSSWSGMTATAMLPAMAAGSSSMVSMSMPITTATSFPVVPAMPMTVPGAAAVTSLSSPSALAMVAPTAAVVATKQVGESKKVETKVRRTTAKVEEKEWINAAIIVDVSGSMAGAKLTTAREACEHIALSLRRTDSLRITSFADTVVEVYRRGKDTPVDKASLKSIIAASMSLTRGSTAFYAAILDYEREYTNNSGGLKKIVVITDGESTEADADALLARCVAFLKSKLAAKHKFWFSLIEVGCSRRTRLGEAIEAMNAEHQALKKGGKGAKAKQRIRVDTVEGTEAGIKKMFTLATTRILKNVKEVQRTVSTVRVASAGKKAALGIPHAQHPLTSTITTTPLVAYHDNPHSGNGAVVVAQGYSHVSAPVAASGPFIPLSQQQQQQQQPIGGPIAGGTFSVHSRTQHHYRTTKVGGSGGRGKWHK